MKVWLSRNMAKLSVSSRRNEFIVFLKEVGCETTEIKKILKTIGEELSLRQIQRVLRNYKILKGHNLDKSSLCDVSTAIKSEMDGPGQLLGYRSMWARLKIKHGLNVCRKTVMMCLALMDREGTAQRKSKKLKRRIYRTKDPNYSWHCDGYDKLKPYGLPIHGCIDGKILWLKVCDSNNNPRYIADHFLCCVSSLGGCPRILRTDFGTENNSIAFLQQALRHRHADSFSGYNSHRYGKSTSNQRIEALWGQLRKSGIEWWISLFKDMIFKGHFNPSISFQKYVFGPFLQAHLDTFVTEWNKHRIRKSNMAEVPHGVPNVLFEFPELKGCKNYICNVSQNDVTELINTYSQSPCIVQDSLKKLADKLVYQYKLPRVNTLNQCFELYFSLKSNF